MYAWIWRHLPGGRRARTLAALALVGLALLVCVHWIFPAISAELGGSGGAVGAGGERPFLLVISDQGPSPLVQPSVGVV